MTNSRSSFIQISFCLLLLFLFIFGLFPHLQEVTGQDNVLLETEHFIFKAFPQASPDLVPPPDALKEIADLHERMVQTMEREFGGKVEKKITVVYGGTAAMQTGDRTVVQPYSKEVGSFDLGGHEVLHILLVDILGPEPPLLFTKEGAPMGYSLGLNEIAVTAFELYFWERSPLLHLYAKVNYDLSDRPSLDFILSPQCNLTGLVLEYPLVSFVFYLLENHPWSNFQLLWKYQVDYSLSPIENTKRALEKAYGKSWSRLEEEWRSFLDKVEVSQPWYETVSRERELHLLGMRIQERAKGQSWPIKIDLNSLKNL